MIHGGFVTCDAFIQPFLEQLYCCGAPNLLVIFEMFYDLWIPVIRACDLRGLLLSLVEREVMNFQLQWKKDFFLANWDSLNMQMTILKIKWQYRVVVGTLTHCSQTTTWRNGVNKHQVWHGLHMGKVNDFSEYKKNKISKPQPESKI